MNRLEKQKHNALGILPISGGETAFDPDAFQPDAFQIEEIVISLCRAFSVPAADRTLSVPTSDRVLSVPASDRVLSVSCS